MVDKKPFVAGITKTAAAKNKFVGVLKLLPPLISASIFLGTYRSKIKGFAVGRIERSFTFHLRLRRINNNINF